MVSEYDFLVLACIASPISNVRSAIRKILGRSNFTTPFREHTDRLILESIYGKSSIPGGAHLIRSVLFAPELAPDTTVFIANLEDGWSTMINCISENIGSAQIVKISTTTQEWDNPFNSFEVLEEGSPIRTVMAYKDGDAWKFFQRGMIQAYERVESYRHRRIRDRLTRNLVVDYLRCVNIGWDLGNSLFWKSNQKCIYFAQSNSIDGRVAK